MTLPLPLDILFIVLVALAFDYTNGFHDAANSIATIVSTRVLPPRYAVIWAAFFNFVAFAVFGVHVAKTIAKGTVDPAVVTPAIVLAALLAALVWNMLTWWWAMPTSSSHALIGGFVGAAVTVAGPNAMIMARHPQDRRVHRRLADGRTGARVPRHADRIVDVPTLNATRGGYAVSTAATGLSGRVQPGTWLQ